MLLSFASSKEEPQRGYNWHERELFGLSVAELGEVMASDFPARFVHKHSLESSEIRKELRITEEEGNGFNVVFQCYIDDELNQEVNVMLSPGEMALVKSLAHNTVPHLLAWSLCVHPLVDERETEKSFEQ